MRVICFQILGEAGFDTTNNGELTGKIKFLAKKLSFNELTVGFYRYTESRVVWEIAGRAAPANTTG